MKAEAERENLIHLTVRVEPDLDTELRRRSMKEERSVGWLVRQALKQYFAKNSR